MDQSVPLGLLNIRLPPPSPAMTKVSSLLLLGICLLSGTWLNQLPVQAAEPVGAAFTAEQLEFFEKRIRPVLVERCFECHGKSDPKGGLSLVSRGALLRGGESGPAVVPGDVNSGELLSALEYDPDGYQMPPDGKLPDQVLADFRRWVEQGAPWPDSVADAHDDHAGFDLKQRAEYWSFQPLVRPDVPRVQQPDWCRTPVDAFVLARLEQAGLQPAGVASQQLWLRRAHYDVLGLPPTPAEVEQFLADDDPAAHARVIDELLASPHFGERWGRHWLDLVRYAESRGHEFDYDAANVWQYRDYVIRAMNADVPYRQFVTEHVAGDLLGPATRFDPASGRNESILGTGFWYLGEWVHSPVDIRQEEAERFDNMIDVYSKTFLGLTVACARCHDHKFDPILQQDFYSLQSFLRSSSYRQVRFETMATEAELAIALQNLREEAGRELLQSFALLIEPTVNDADKYLLAAQAVLAEGLDLKRSADEVVFADFETGTYAGWTAEGDAFGLAPHSAATLAPYQGEVNFSGKYLVNSHQLRDGGRGDVHTGRLTSDPFPIDRRYIRFWIGGGAHAGRTCVNLLVDEQVVRTATGKNSNRMSVEEWDVSDLQGRTARLQVVDEERGGWGNIGFDHVVFSDRSLSGAERLTVADFEPRMQRKFVQAAREYGVHVEILKHWVAALGGTASDPFLQAFLRELPATGSSAPDGKAVLESALQAREVQIVADYRERAQPITDGPVFATGVVASGAPMLNWLHDGQPVTGIAQFGYVARDRFWDGTTVTIGTIGDPGNTENWQRGGRLLQTPKFEIQQPRLWALVRGAARTYACVDSHITIRGPLHGSLTREHAAQPEWHWIVHDVSRYSGHWAHLEFVPLNDEDCAIALVVQAPADWQAPFISTHQPLVSPVEQALPEARAARLRQLLEAAVNQLLRQEPTAGSEFSKADRLAAIHWLLTHSSLAGLQTEDLQRWQQLAEPFRERYRQLWVQRPLVSATAPAMLENSRVDEYVFVRGNWKKPGPIAARNYLTVFRQAAAAQPGEREVAVIEPAEAAEVTRLTLAADMLDHQRTPLTARVIVNRIWLHYFGRGLVNTPDDFGHLGQTPSHPELLDWLALELIEHDWSLKHIHRLILNSATYRMSSETATDPQVATIDPDNVLLHRMNLKRLEGEAVRDAILTSAGQLSPVLYGPSVPIHLTEFLEGRGRPASGPLDGQGRRSVYLSVRRNFPEPLLQAFDFPVPHTTIGRRSVSNVPAQALALMNHPLVVQQAEIWASQLRTSPADLQQRISLAYQHAFQREPTAAERERALEFLQAQAAEYGCSPDDQRVWTDFCQALWNSKEFIFIR